LQSSNRPDCSEDPDDEESSEPSRVESSDDDDEDDEELDEESVPSLDDSSATSDMSISAPIILFPHSAKTKKW